MGKPYAELIGDPVEHSWSPPIHLFWLKKLGIAGDYRRVRVRGEELGDYLETRRRDPDWCGCNVTMPLKEKVVPLLDHLDDQALKIGAVNCVVSAGDTLFGTNTDIWGVMSTLGLFDAVDPVILIGTGGAARAVLSHLQGIDAIEVHVFGRNREKAKSLLERFELQGKGWMLGEVPEIPFPMRLINATPLGMKGQPPMPEQGLALVDHLPPYAGVFDMIYDPLETELLARARERQLRAVNGLAMLLGQARSSFELFFDTRPSVSLDDELCGILTS